LNSFLKKIKLLGDNKIDLHIQEANRIMEKIDLKDSPFIAAAIAIKADGIWTFDKDFDKQSEIKIFTTENLLKMIGL